MSGARGGSLTAMGGFLPVRFRVELRSNQTFGSAQCLAGSVETLVTACARTVGRIRKQMVSDTVGARLQTTVRGILPATVDVSECCSESGEDARGSR